MSSCTEIDELSRLIEGFGASMKDATDCLAVCIHRIVESNELIVQLSKELDAIKAEKQNKWLFYNPFKGRK